MTRSGNRNVSDQVPDGKRYAKQVAAQIQARLALGQPIFEEKPDLMTIETRLLSWLKEHAVVNCKPSTFASYQWAIQRILVPEFGTLPLDGLTVDHVRKLIAKCTEKGKSKATIRNYLAPLRATMTQSVDEGIVSRNPVAKLGKLLKNTRNTAKEMCPLTRQETVTLLDSARTKDSAI